MIDRTPEEAPPVLVAIVGPKGVGKSTLVKSLVKRFTKHTINELNGPITVVSGKKRRVTFFECGTDLNSMIDISKVADLVLLMIDGNFGFEMETMEFLQIASVHGFPRILGVVTHLDLFKTIGQARAAKKALKNRFWTEVYKGAKLFYLSGVMNGRYPDREILNLARFISVLKFRPLKWRNEHPYMLADRFTDLTHPQVIESNPKSDRKIALYGFLRGTHLKKGQPVHIPGVGDVVVAEIEKLNDPCPTPQAIKREEGRDGTTGRRRLDDKLKTLYAPMSDVGGVMIDKDAVYIDIGTQAFDKDANQNAGLGERMVMDLQHAQRSLDASDRAGIQLFSNSEAICDLENIANDEIEDGDEEPGNGDSGRKMLRNTASHEQLSAPNIQEQSVSEEFAFASDSELDEEDFDPEAVKAGLASEDFEGESGTKWKNRLKPANYKRHFSLSKLIYSDISAFDVVRRWKDPSVANEEKENLASGEEDDGFLKVRERKVNFDRPRLVYDDLELSFSDFDDLFYREVKPGSAPDGENEYEDAEGGSDFEDLESQTDNASDEEDSTKQVEQKVASNGEGITIKGIEEARAENAQKKLAMRLQFDSDEDKASDDEKNPDMASWYDKQKARISKQLDINETELADLDEATRRQIEGYRSGSYVRLLFNDLPCEFADYFDPKYPLIIGGLLSNETRFGFSQVRIKKHRWYPRLLKTNDPVVVSLGWRRFQTCPIYTTSDSRTRTRMLKYTPEHMFCNAAMWGPLVSPNTGLACFPSVSEQDAKANFRVSGTGTVEEIDQEVEIVKKLKLVGHPYKIFKNTAFVKDMFHSSMEIARFEGAQIKTVSGIRGQIKKALTTEGCFRATFEDKVLMSDIILLRAWWPVRARQFYNPVTSLLLADKKQWVGMRQTGAIRAERQLSAPQKKDSSYGPPVERVTRRFNPLQVPKQLRQSLPFKSQIATMAPQNRKTYIQKRAVVVDGEEKKLRDMMVKVNTLRNEKDAKRQQKKDAQRAKTASEQAKIAARKEEKRRELRKEHFAKEGRKRSAEESQHAKRAKR